MTPIKRNLLYIFRGDLLRLRVTWAGKSLTLSAGYHVDRSKWDGQRCRRNSTHGTAKVSASVVNKVLENLESRLDGIFYSFEMTDTIPSADDVRRLLSPDSSNTHGPTVADLLPKYMAEQGTLRQWSYNTSRMTKRSIHMLIDAFGSQVRLEDIDEGAVVKLLTYMTNKVCPTSPTHNRGLNNNSINHYLAFIGTFARWAVEKGHCKGTVLTRKNRQLKTARRPMVYLTVEELRRFRAAAQTEAQKEAADIFTFCCFTGLRYSDVAALRWDQVKENHVEVVTKKTNDLIRIDLNDHSRAVLAGRTASTGTVFNVPDNTEYNLLTKAIAKEAGINSPVSVTTYTGGERRTVTLPKWNFVTSHTPRKTFVCLALSLGIPPQVVMKWTGHKNYESMKPYIDIVSEVKKENMDKFNKI